MPNHLTMQTCLHLGHYKLNSSTHTKLSLKFKIDDLSNSNDNLKQQITTTSETITSASLQSQLISRPPTSSAQDIAYELADRECRKSKLIVCNLSESSDDKKHFIDLCNTIFKLDTVFL